MKFYEVLMHSWHKTFVNIFTKIFYACRKNVMEFYHHVHCFLILLHLSAIAENFDENLKILGLVNSANFMNFFKPAFLIN